MKRLIAAHVSHDALQSWSDSRVCSFVGCPLPLDLLRISRLTYYRSLLSHGPDILWALIGLEALLQRLAEDLNWMWKQVGPLPLRPSPTEDPDFWTQMAVQQPGVWRSLLKKVYAKTLLCLSIDTKVYVWHKVFEEFLVDMDFPIQPSRVGPAQSRMATQACLACGQLFKTKAAWAVHCFRKHHRRAPHRYLADGATCDVCGKLFLNHVRLSDHLRNPLCAQELRNRGHVCAPLPGRNSRAWRQADPYTQCPYVISAGPRISTLGEADDLTPDDLSFSENLMSLEDSIDLSGPLLLQPHWETEIHKVCFTTYLEIDRIRQHLCAWSQDLAERWFRPRLRPLHVAELHRAILEVAQAASVPYFLPDQYEQWLRGCPTPEHVSAEQKIHEVASNMPIDYMPNPRNFPRFRQLVFAHLYSGHRREGCLQACLELRTS